MTRCRLSPTDPSMAPEGFGLLRDAYLRARGENPLLPPLTPEHEARLQRRFERAFGHGGVAASRAGRLCGFMVAGPPFAYRGLVAALVPEFGHGVAKGEGVSLYGPLYAALGERLVRNGAHLHLIGHFVAERSTKRSLYDLGFGAVVSETLRDLSDVPRAAVATADTGDLARVEHVGPLARWDVFAPLAAEHAAYYRASPLFLSKDDALETARAELDEHRLAGDQLFVSRAHGEPLAYLVAGRCQGVSEGRLLEGTATAQVRSAYAVPAARRRGIGSALLQGAVAWARREGFERLFVEHETANLHGGPFWRRHFVPFLVFSMRYVDRSL